MSRHGLLASLSSTSIWYSNSLLNLPSTPMRVRGRSTTGLDGVSGSSGKSRKSTCDLKRMPTVSRFPTFIAGRLSKVSFTCASAGAAAAHSRTAIEHTRVKTTRGGQLLIDRSRGEQTVDVAQPLEHSRRTQWLYRETLLMRIEELAPVR